MYFFYLDESGSRDLNLGSPENPTHIYVLLAIGMYEGEWRDFERQVSGTKRRLAYQLRNQGMGSFDLAECEVKSNWLRNPKDRKNPSGFLAALEPSERQTLTDVYLEQVRKRHTVIIASVIDKRHIYSTTTSEGIHHIAYEFLLERVQNYMTAHNPWHQALIIVDDTSIQLNRSVAMRHERFLRSGNWNTAFQNIVEYPFFTRSELSNGIQLADQVAYNVYRAFRNEDMEYPYFEGLLTHFYQSTNGRILHGLKVWPDESPLVDAARTMWAKRRQKALSTGGPQFALVSGWASHIKLP